MRYSHAIWRASLRLAVTSFSLVFLLVSAWAGHFSDLAARMKSAPSDSAALTLVKSDEIAMRIPDIFATFDEGADSAATRKKVQAQIELCALQEGETSPPPKLNPKQVVSDVKQSLGYRDPGIEQQPTWLLDALSRLRFRPPHIDAPSASAPKWLIPVVWVLLGIVILVAIFFGAKAINWKRALRRKSRAVLEEDEPERTLDEWLLEADRLAALGKYREAVRGLYLACLLKLDEGRVARFDRRQTNWEHLARIETSPRLPEGLDFRTPTKEFDHIWYGFVTKGEPDVARFREWYRTVSAKVSGVESAK